MTTEIVELSALAGAVRHLNLLICSASFEERCLSVPMAVGSADRCIVAYNENYWDVLSEHRDMINNLSWGAVEECRMRTDDPVQTSDAIGDAVEMNWPEDVEGLRVGVDITTFTRESLLMLMRQVWRKMRERDELVICYNPAVEYSVGAPDAKKWLSKGIREVRSVLGYPGLLAPSRRNHLIVLAGFEADRAVGLIGEWEPALLSLGVADAVGGDTGEHQSINEERARRVENVAGPVRHFVFDAYDVLSATEAIEDQMNVGEGVNTIVAPMNTKISTVGAALVGCRHPEVQLCYAQADLYNYDHYSEASSRVYVIEGRGSEWCSNEA